MSSAAITLVILALVVVIFVVDRLPVMAVALSVPVALWATGVLDLGEAFESFGDPTIIFIASLFVVSEALDATGVTAWVGELALRAAGESRTRLLVVIMAMVALTTAVITPNGSVAALTPVVVMMAIRAKRSPSELLLPLAFGAHAGSLLMLTGSPVNLVIADYVEEATGTQLGLFTISVLGVALVLGTIALVVLFGPALIPHRTPRRSLRDLGAHSHVLSKQYRIGNPEGLLTRADGLLEAQIPPRSQFVGEQVHPGMRTDSGKLVVVAVEHRGQTKYGVHALHVGDTVLFRGAWDDLNWAAQDPNILVVDDPEKVRRQAVPLGPGARITLSILGIMVILLAGNIVPAAIAGLLAALAVIVTRVLSVQQVYEGIGWTTVILVGGLMPLSTAMEKSGAAALLADGLVEIVGDAGPYALLAGLFVVTVVLGQLISNMATAFIVVPVGLAAAAQMGVSPMPVLMAILVFAAAALLTPIATPANLVVMEAAGYRFGDYWKMGGVLLALYALVGIGLVPLIWPF
ncbi:MAG TPA: SLC13 family permease [Actinomycetaceae bacterium]|nr:SLC13 family permease [Actinomycetaceae bacterium]